MFCTWKLIRQCFDDEYKLKLGKNTIGRGLDSNIRCGSVFVSRTHCVIEISGDDINIIDSTSSNGTYLNHHMIPRNTCQTLNNNDIIGLGIPVYQPANEDFFVFKLVNSTEEDNEVENTEQPTITISTSEKRPSEDNDIMLQSNKRKKIDEEYEFQVNKKIKVEEASEIEDNMLLNYTQSDNDVIEISDDEGSLAQIFEKSFKPGVLANLEPASRHLLELDDDVPEGNNEIICITSDNEDNEDDDVDKWINKLSQNYSITHKNSPESNDDAMPEIENVYIKGLPLSQSLLKMIDEEAKADQANETKSDNLNFTNLDEYNFIDNYEKTNQHIAEEPSKSSPAIKKTFVKPPIIECSSDMIHRPSSSGARKKSKSPSRNKTNNEQSSNKSLNKTNPVKSKKGKNKTKISMEKEEKRKIGQIRKDKLKELADKSSLQKDATNSTKISTKPKVKLEDLPRIPKKSKKSTSDNIDLQTDVPVPHSEAENINSVDNHNNKYDEKSIRIGIYNMEIRSTTPVNINEYDAEMEDVSEPINKMETPNKPIRTLKSCLKSAEKSKGSISIKIKLRPQIRYFEIDEGNSLKKCNVKDLSLNWHQKKQPIPAICTQSAIVNKIENIDNVIGLITTWNPTWLDEQKNNPLPPPLFQDTHYKQSPMLHSYTSYDDYEKTVFPLIINEFWSCISKEWETRESIPDRRKKTYFIGVNKIIPPSDHQKTNNHNVMLIQCHMILNKHDYDKGIHPREGDYIIMGLVQNSQSKNNETPKDKTNIRKRFAFVSRSRKTTARDQEINLNLLKTPNIPFGIIYFELKTKNKSLNLNNKEPIIAYIVSNINPHLRNFKALLALPSSKLYNNILCPKIEHFTHPNEVNSNINMISSLSSLNASQKSAVAEAISDCLLPEPFVTMIQGPPGTGKSQVIVSIIQQLLHGQNLKRSKRPKILICAPSNAAIDEITCRLLKFRQSITIASNKFKMVRFGMLESMNAVVQDISLQSLSDRDCARQISNMKYADTDSLENEKRLLEAKINSLKLCIENMNKCNKNTYVMKDRLTKCERKLNLLCTKNGDIQMPSHQYAQMKRESQRLILCGADIICTTLSRCVNSQMLSSNIYFNICIIDEATQCTEPETLMPLMLGISKLILVGDRQQLPATIISQVSKNFGFQRSLFSRIESCLEHAEFSPVKKLTLQYRMHPDICYFPNHFFYGGCLQSHKGVNDNNTMLPYLVFSLNYSQNQDFSNDEEANFVINLASTVMKLTSKLNYKVGIITPYQNQKMCIIDKYDSIQRSSCFQNRFLDVHTIDSIQGQERDVIIISLVRSDGIRFLSDFERLNVALTRAKQSLFVCGNFASLKKHDMWAAFMKDAMDRNLFRDASNISVINYDNILNSIAKL